MWRKELMMLSRKLDPAIANINNHPEGAVEDIADWIKHNREYSLHIQFEYVKSVIACGVTLSRCKIWNRFRNNEPKPNDLSNRSWRLMRKEYTSPLMQKIFENCRRANAACINFDRTGPSGKIGVRERLRGTLDRSPDPEEISFEMRREKGAQRVRGIDKSKNIMNNTGQELQALVQISNTGVIGALGEGVEVLVSDPASTGKGNPGESGRCENVLQEKAAPPTDEEIYKHPIVMRLLEQLHAKDSEDNIAVPKENNATIGNAGNVEENGSECSQSILEAHVGAQGMRRVEDTMGSGVRCREKRRSRMV